MKDSSSQTSLTITAIIVALGIVVGSTAVNAFLMMTTTTPAYAAPSKEKQIVLNEGVGALAIWDVNNLEVPGLGTLVHATVDVFGETEEGTANIHVQLTTTDGNCAEGFTTIDPNLFDADKKLTSATLSPVTMEVVIYENFCSGFSIIGTAEITIQATWEGIGDVSKSSFKDRGTSEEEGFSFKFKFTTQSREAIAEVSINGADLGTSDAAKLSAFKAVEMTVSESIIT